MSKIEVLPFEVVDEFKVALRNCDIPEELSNRELVESYIPWAVLREKAMRLVAALNFDLERWEKSLPMV